MTGVANPNTKLKALKRFSVLLLAVLICLPLFAQQTGISGRVGDPSSAVIANVRVIATAEDGTNVTTTTNATGLYQFPGLRAGFLPRRPHSSVLGPVLRVLCPDRLISS